MTILLQKLDWLAERASQFTAYLAALVLLWLVGLTCVDVVGRYFFRAPVTGAVELVQLSMAGIIFLTLPLMFLKNEHVIVDLFSFRKPAGLTGVSSGLKSGNDYRHAGTGRPCLGLCNQSMGRWRTAIYLHIPRYLTVGLITASIYLSTLFLSLRVIHMMQMHPNAVMTVMI